MYHISLVALKYYPANMTLNPQLKTQKLRTTLLPLVPDERPAYFTASITSFSLVRNSII